MLSNFHHVAFRCRNAAETTQFYTEVLGLKYSHAVLNEVVPSTGAKDPHLHIFFELDDGSSIAFFDVPKSPMHTASNISGRSAIIPTNIRSTSSIPTAIGSSSICPRRRAAKTSPKMHVFCSIAGKRCAPKAIGSARRPPRSDARRERKAGRSLRAPSSFAGP